MQAVAQTSWLPLWSKESWLLDRLEIKAQSNTALNLNTAKPYMRAAMVAVADSLWGQLQQQNNPLALSAVDQYNLQRLQANSSEYSRYKATDMPGWRSKKAWGKGLFETKANMLEVDKPNFYLSVNPAMAYQRSIESDYSDPVYFRALGATGRGLIGKKVAFQFLATANSEQGPLQFRQMRAANRAVPGYTRYDSIDGNKAYQYIDFRGSVSTSVTKYIQVQFGYDQQTIGNGYRSLLLSNFAPSALFVKLNTRIWKLNYTNLYMQLQPIAGPVPGGRFGNKYAAMHHLSLQATKWLNIGLFEGIIFGRSRGYDISYMLPLIFYRSIEQQNGSPDNANIGFDFKANIAKRLQLYGQLMLDEFVKDEVIGGRRKWWGNKQGIQLGAKYVDAFGIKNLDLQAEMNQIRPFMYQFRDTTGAYTHALQPLAHPLGANLRELIGIARYQPNNRLYFFGRVNWWKQGLDSAGFNFGANPNELYNPVSAGGTRPRGDNFPLFAGMPATGLNAQLTASYELKENLFVELGATLRRYQETGKAAVNTTLLSAGIRWNMFRRDYDY